MRLLSPARVVLLTVALGFVPRAAAAQPSDRAQATAKPFAEQGIEHYHEGRYAEALQALERAEAAFSAPVHRVYMARANAKLGRLIEAKRLYDDALAEPPKPNENTALTAIREAARREADALRVRIPSLRLAVSGVPRDSVRVRVDRRSIPLGELERGVAINPGEHTIAVTVEGRTSRTRTVTLAEGSADRLEIVFDEPAPVQPAAADPSSSPDPGERPEPDERPEPEPRPEVDETTGSSRIPAAIAFGLGAVGLGVGAATGVMSLNKVSDIKSRCVDGHCPPEDAANGDAAGTLAVVSTVSFVAGAVGVVTGVVLLSISGDRRAAGVRPPLRLGVGPGSFTLSGTF